MTTNNEIHVFILTDVDTDCIVSKFEFGSKLMWVFFFFFFKKLLKN